MVEQTQASITFHQEIPTVITSTPATAKEWFDLLVQTSADGKFPAAQTRLDMLPSCRYRTEDGRACVAGLLIPDINYDSSFEGKTCTLERIESAISLPADVTWGDVEEAQNVHDSMVINDTTEPGGPLPDWDHEVFVKALITRVPCFQTFSPTAHAVTG